MGRPKLRRGKGWFTDKLKSAWSKVKSGVSSLWNNNKGMLQAKALSLANQAKDRAIQYAREKKLLSSTVNRILPSRYGIDKLASDYVAKTTGMGRRRRVGRPKRYGRGFFGDLYNGARSAVSMVAPAVIRYGLNKVTGGKRRKARRTKKIARRGRGAIGSILGSMLPW